MARGGSSLGTGPYLHRVLERAPAFHAVVLLRIGVEVNPDGGLHELRVLLEEDRVAMDDGLEYLK